MCFNDLGFSFRFFMTDYISTSKSPIAFMGLAIKTDKPRMNAKSRAIMNCNCN